MSRSSESRPKNISGFDGSKEIDLELWRHIKHECYFNNLAAYIPVVGSRIEPIYLGKDHWVFHGYCEVALQRILFLNHLHRTMAQSCWVLLGVSSVSPAAFLQYLLWYWQSQSRYVPYCRSGSHWTTSCVTYLEKIKCQIQSCLTPLEKGVHFILPEEFPDFAPILLGLHEGVNHVECSDNSCNLSK
jgi:hypothetical protein